MSDLLLAEAPKTAKRNYETSEYSSFVRRALRAYGRRVADADEVDLLEMVEIMSEIDEMIVLPAVRGMRERGQSWTYIAKGLRMTPAGARQKYGPRL